MLPLSTRKPCLCMYASSPVHTPVASEVTAAPPPSRPCRGRLRLIKSLMAWLTSALMPLWSRCSWAATLFRTALPDTVWKSCSARFKHRPAQQGVCDSVRQVTGAHSQTAHALCFAALPLRVGTWTKVPQSYVVQALTWHQEQDVFCCLPHRLVTANVCKHIEAAAAANNSQPTLTLLVTLPCKMLQRKATSLASQHATNCCGRCHRAASAPAAPVCSSPSTASSSSFCCSPSCGCSCSCSSPPARVAVKACSVCPGYQPYDPQ